MTRSDEERRIAQIARDLAERPGAAVFLKQAAVLHSDAAMIIGLPASRTPLAANVRATGRGVRRRRRCSRPAAAPRGTKAVGRL